MNDTVINTSLDRKKVVDMLIVRAERFNFQLQHIVDIKEVSASIIWSRGFPTVGFGYDYGS